MTPHRSPLTGAELVDEYFIENRNRVLEIAAFLDRIDRQDATVSAGDFRMRALGDAIRILATTAGDRVFRIQMLLSDPTEAPRASLDRKGAIGAYDPSR
jgi:hypothetical protein